MRPRITAMRLISSEMPWKNSSTKPIRISDFAGHCGSPPAFIDCSLSSNDRRKNGTDVMIMTIVSGSRKNTMAEDVDAVAPSLRQHVVDDVDADVLVGEQCPRRAQQEYRAEQDPLQLQPGIRRHVEHLAHRGVGGRNDHHDQDQPGQHLADPEIDRVDGAAQLEQTLHGRSPVQWSRTPPGCRPELRSRRILPGRRTFLDPRADVNW